jgi:signal transduction histidine kinase
MIGLANRLEPYDLDHEQLLLTYAAQVAIVIRNAQLYEQLTTANEALERKVASRTQELEEAKASLAQKANQLQQLLTETVDVQERERQRIAQDLHDGSNHWGYARAKISPRTVEQRPFSQSRRLAAKGANHPPPD